MFVPSMTPAEKKAEALKDLGQMKTKIEMALDTVKKHLNQGLIYTPVRRIKITSKNNNIWTISFVCVANGIGVLISAPIKTQAHKRDKYIAFSDIEPPIIMEYTAHFLERYYERYLLPNNIKTGYLTHFEHFQLYNRNIIFNNKENGYMVSNHGYMVANEPVNKMLVHLTFIGDENLSNRKAAIYSRKKGEMDAANELLNHRGEVTQELMEQISLKYFDKIEPEFIERWKRWTT